jgi:predicted DsbA family dithiol-disulfide isomerase
VARERAAWLVRQVGATVEWFPYDLHPEYPPEGIPRAQLVARYGDHFNRIVQQSAADSGLPFNPHPERVPNSRRALELSEWARAQGGDAHERLHERLMDAYWADGRDIGSWEVLRESAADAGLDPDAGQLAVESGEWAEAVDASTGWAQRHGIMAVPAFVIGGRVLVSGAVPHEDLMRGVERALELARTES